MATLSDLSFPRKWGRVASGGLVAASRIPDRNKLTEASPWLSTSAFIFP